MQEISLGDVDILKIGNEIQIAGTIWTGAGYQFITLLPDKKETFDDLKIMPLTLPEWEKLIRQADLLETEMFARDPTGKLVKILFRKSQRQIDSYLQWDCFRRDNYTCQYCGRTGIPLTVDHADLYELGGATIKENLVSACRSCNKDRGRMEFDVWIKSPIYLRKSQNLPESIKQHNLELVGQLPHLQTLRVYHVRTR